MLQHTSFQTAVPYHRPASDTGQRSHYFFNADESLSRAFTKPYQHFIEMNEYLHLGNVLQFVAREYPHTSLSLTTKTAFQQPVAENFCQHIARQRQIPEVVISDIRTCLQEAVMNSIIHGNLTMEHGEQQASDFQRYLEEITLRMDDPSLGLKRVSIYCWFTANHVTLCVADQGKGFSLALPEPDIAQPYGRGLPLMRALAASMWQSRPNHLYMQFGIHA